MRKLTFLFTLNQMACSTVLSILKIQLMDFFRDTKDQVKNQDKALWNKLFVLVIIKNPKTVIGICYAELPKH